MKPSKNTKKPKLSYHLRFFHDPILVYGSYLSLWMGYPICIYLRPLFRRRDPAAWRPMTTRARSLSRNPHSRRRRTPHRRRRSPRRRSQRRSPRRRSQPRRSRRTPRRRSPFLRSRSPRRRRPPSPGKRATYGGRKLWERPVAS